jgi:hypothetical protein
MDEYKFQRKTELKARNIAYEEVIIGKDITTEEIKEMFPGKNALPILLTEFSVHSGPGEILPILDSYKEFTGKELLNEDIGRFVNEGGFDKC